MRNSLDMCENKRIPKFGLFLVTCVQFPVCLFFLFVRIREFPLQMKLKHTLSTFLHQQIGDSLNKKGIHEMDKNGIVRYEHIVASWAQSLVWGPHSEEDKL